MMTLEELYCITLPSRMIPNTGVKHYTHLRATALPSNGNPCDLFKIETLTSLYLEMNDDGYCPVVYLNDFSIANLTKIVVRSFTTSTNLYSEGNHAGIASNVGVFFGHLHNAGAIMQQVYYDGSTLKCSALDAGYTGDTGHRWTVAYNSSKGEFTFANSGDPVDYTAPRFGLFGCRNNYDTRNDQESSTLQYTENCTFHYARFYGENDTLLHNFVPVTLTWMGESSPALWDKVENVVYPVKWVY